MTSFTQQTFLGASIKSFNASIGWSDSPSTLRATVVEDDLQGDNFNPPAVGQPVHFRYSGWHFGGILQSWTEHKGSDANPIYNIEVQDPRRILEGVQLILQGYNGGTYGINNLYNIYGYLESKYGFGGSQANQTGVPWYLITTAFYELQQTYPIMYRGYFYQAPLFYGLPILPDYYRIPGDNISVLEYVEHVCDVASMDYFITLVGNQIIVNLINRQTAPTFGLIDYYISTAGGNVVSKEVGRELRNEPVSKFVVGGQVESMYYQSNSSGNENTRNDDTIWPYWGHNAYGQLVIGQGAFEGDDGGYHSFVLDGRELYLETGDPFFIHYHCNVDELRHALAGQESWESYLRRWNDNVDENKFLDSDNRFANIHIGKADRIGLGGGLNTAILDAFKKNITKFIGIRDVSFAPLDVKQIVYSDVRNDQQLAKVQRIYQFIHKYATEYYGKKFMVRIPFVLGKRDSESYKVTLSVEPTDGGFVDESAWSTAYQNGLLPYDVNKVTKPDGRVVPFCRFDGIGTLISVSGVPQGVLTRYVLENISPEDYTMDQYPGQGPDRVREHVFIKCDQDPNVVFLDYTTLYSPRVVITLPAPVKDREQTAKYCKFFYNEVLKIFTSGTANPTPWVGVDAERAANEALKAFGSEHMWMSKDYGCVIPDVAALALKSNILTYGPWYATSNDGRVEYEKDDSLVPWNFGGYSAMNYAGLAKVEDAMSGQQAAEKGYLEYEGPPELSLGGELIAGGPVVTDVDVNIGEEGATTTYRMNTWSWEFGKMNKYNAERYKNFAKLAQEQRRAFRQVFDRVLSLDNRINFANITGMSLNRRQTPHSSAKVIGADMIYYDDGDEVTSRSNVAFMPPYQLGAQITKDNYYQKAGISLDGLLRPCTTRPSGDNTGHFPHFETPEAGADTPNVLHLNPFNGTHDISIAFPDQSGVPNNLALDITEDYPEHSRVVGLRMPLIGVGWGWDTDGNPVPSSGDGQFIENYKTRMDQWKAGPVDMRWDDSKKCWVASAGGDSTIKMGKLNSNLYKTDDVQSVNVTEYTMSSSGTVDATDNIITAYDWLIKSGSQLYGGDKVVLAKIGSNYFIINAECPC